MNGERCVGELVVQLVDFLDQQLQAFHLHRRARKAVEHDAVAIRRLQQLAQQEAHDLLVADHDALRLQLLHLGRRQQLADHDRRTGQPARLVDELRLRALAGAGSTAEQDDLFRKAKILAADLFLEVLPGRGEDDARILDLEVEDLRRRAVGDW